MATATSNQVCDNSTNANFRAWGSAISSAFGTTCGWTQTADTGQVNWTTVTVPSSTYVYEVWKDADSLFYVKVEYGFSSTTVDIRITVGTGSNGSGTITGTIAFNAQSICNATGKISNQGAGTTFPCYFSGDSRNFRMLMWINTATTSVPLFFCLERSRDTSGVATTDYLTCVFVSGSNGGTRNRQQTVMGAGGLVTIAETQIICLGISTNTSFNGTVAAFPIFPLVGKPGNPMLGFMAASKADIADASSVTVASMYGGTHTYIACKSGGGFAFDQVGKTSEAAIAGCVLMLYE